MNFFKRWFGSTETVSSMSPTPVAPVAPGPQRRETVRLPSLLQRPPMSVVTAPSPQSSASDSTAVAEPSGLAVAVARIDATRSPDDRAAGLKNRCRRADWFSPENAKTRAAIESDGPARLVWDRDWDKAYDERTTLAPPKADVVAVDAATPAAVTASPVVPAIPPKPVETKPAWPALDALETWIRENSK